MTKEELQAKREQMAVAYDRVVNTVICAENVVQCQWLDILKKARDLPSEEERIEVIRQYQHEISREIMRGLTDKEVEQSDLVE